MGGLTCALLLHVRCGVAASSRSRSTVSTHTVTVGHAVDALRAQTVDKDSATSRPSHTHAPSGEPRPMAAAPRRGVGTRPASAATAVVAATTTTSPAAVAPSTT